MVDLAVTERKHHPMPYESVCSFCSELAHGEMPATFHPHTPVRHRLMDRNGLFALLPSVAPLAVGHLMLVPIEHVRSVAQLPAKERIRVIGAAAKYAARLAHGHEAVALFEHGVGTELEGGCGVDHAHVHLVPTTRAAIAEARRRILLDYRDASRYDLKSFLDATPASESYLWFGASDGPVSAVRTHEIPSQYLRRTLGELVGREWDWRRLSGWMDFQASLATI
jgi:diadenosine tetraphosphate (Ap4A) HIT family hydrolase